MYLRKPINNLTEVGIGSTIYFFSYETVVAYKYRGEVFLSENVWSKTTGKHLNHIKQMYPIFTVLPHEVFKENLEYILSLEEVWHDEDVE